MRCDLVFVFLVVDRSEKTSEQVERKPKDGSRAIPVNVFHSCLIFMAAWLVNHIKEHNDDDHGAFHPEEWPFTLTTILC